MSKKLQLSIPQPCHENWDAMTPLEKGRFCDSCQKQVVDFSNMSDRQVAEFFKKPSTGSVCGRFMTDQLERHIEIPKKRIPWLKYFFQFTIPAFLVSIKASAEKMQGKVLLTTTIPVKPPKVNTSQVEGLTILPTDTTFKSTRLTLGTVTKQVCTKPLMGDIKIMPEVVVVTQAEVNKTTNTDIQTALAGKVSGPVVTKVHDGRTTDITKIRDLSIPSSVNLSYGLIGTVGMVSISRIEAKSIKGKVIDKKGDPLTGVSLVIKGTRIGCLSSNDGSFSLAPQSGWEKITIVSSGIGLEPAETVIDKKNYYNNVIVMDYLMISCRANIAYKTKEEQNPLIPLKSSNQSAVGFKIFPNPVSSGTNLNIEVKQAEEGYYSLQLLNQSGQSVHNQKIWIDAEAKLLSIDMPVLPCGNYFLVLVNKNSGKRFTEKLILQ